MAEVAFPVIKTTLEIIYDTISNKFKAHDLAIHLKKRLEVLIGPINKLSELSVSHCPAITHLQSNLQKLKDLIIEISERNILSKVAFSANHKKLLKNLKTYISDCVNDLIILNVIDNTTENERRQEELKMAMHEGENRIIRTVQDEVNRIIGPVQEGNRMILSIFEAKCQVFWNQISNRLDSMTDFENFRRLENAKLSTSVKSLGNIDRDYMMGIQQLESQSEYKEPSSQLDLILKRAKAQECLERHMDDSPPCQFNISLKLISVSEAHPLQDFSPNEVLLITPTHIHKGSVIQTRVVRFGRGSPELNHICISEDDEVVPLDLCQIFSKPDGYYIADSLNEGYASIRLKPEQPELLSQDLVFSIGRGIIFTISEVSPSEISLEILSINNVLCEDPPYSFDSEKREISIGKISSRSPKDIMFNDETVSRMHAMIYYRDGNWELVDKSSNGTWLYLKKYDRLIPREEFEPRKLENGDIIGARLYRFEVEFEYKRKS